MAITKPPVRAAWADTAVPVTDIVDPGNAFVAGGWPMTSTPPARQYFNWVLNFNSNGIRYLCRRGVVDYDAAETYQIGDIVQGDLGYLVQSLTANNIGHTPSTSPTQWGPLNNYPNTAQVQSAIATALLTYVTQSNLSATLAAYVTTATLTSTLAAYVTNASLANTLLSYETTAALTQTLASYATIASLSVYETIAAFNATIAAYATTASLNAAVAPLLSTAAFNATIANYWTAAIVSANLAAKANLLSPTFSGAPAAPTAAPGTSTTQLATTAFVMGASSLSANGYSKLPSGLMFAWGTCTIPSAGAVKVLFSPVFPNNCFGVQVVPIPPAGGTTIGSLAGTFVYGLSTSQFYADNSAAVADMPAYWFAYGN